jgi:AcrR family transcriptional regulator
VVVASEKDALPAGEAGQAGEEPPRFPRRAASAQRTRQALVSAAGALFAEKGYRATTIQAIADRAGVARPTVFTAVPGGKPQLLKEARDRALAGDDEPVPVPQRPWFRHAMSQTDPRELIRLQSGNYGQIHSRAAALERELATAAASDPELAELYGQARWQRHRGAELVAARIAELGGLAPGTGLAGAADTIYALASPDVYLLLVSDRGWTGQAYERWLSGQLQRALLR